MTIHESQPPRMPRFLRILALGSLVSALVPLEAAAAESVERHPLRLHGEGGLNLMLSEPYSSRFESGANAIGRLGVDITGPLSFQASVASLLLPAYEGRSGRMHTLEGGLRASFTEGNGLLGGPVIDLNAGVGFTGGLRRVVVDPGVGWEFVFSDWIAGGPMLRYMHIVQPDSDPEPTDGRLLLAGIGFTFGVPIQASVAPPPEEDPFERDRGIARAEVSEREPEPEDPLDDGARAKEPETQQASAAPVAPEPPPRPSSTTLKEQVHFALGRAQFKGQENNEALRDVCQQMQDDPRLKLRVTGHADETGSSAYNQALAAQRAATVAQWMMASCDLPASRVEIAAHGDSRPLCSDASESCYAKNRRVEFEVFEP